MSAKRFLLIIIFEQIHQSLDDEKYIELFKKVHLKTVHKHFQHNLSQSMVKLADRLHVLDSGF